MESIIYNKLLELQKKYIKIKNIINEPNLNFNNKNYHKLFKNYTKLNKINNYFKNWLCIKKTIKITKELLKDKEMHNIAKEELKILYKKKKKLNIKIKLLLLPNIPEDKNNCFLEIKAGTGGNEASLFVSNLFNMYYNFAEIKNWKIKIINIINNEKGGYKEIMVKFCHKGAYGKLKFESGGHRVQRIPKTENQGRIHTSTCTVAVIPEAPSIKLKEINKKDLRIDTFRSSGSGGQHVNTTDSAIRVTHLPTGIIVECQDERSQHKNKKKALSVLKKRLYLFELKKKKEKESNIKKNLLGSGERSDRIRTYNFPQGRITDHRINLSIYKLEEVMKGKLDIIIKHIIKEHKSNQINNLSEIIKKNI